MSQTRIEAMIQEGLRTIDIIESEQARGPEKHENIVDFLRILAKRRYSSVTIVGIHEIYFTICALHMGVENIRWYSNNDSLDNYLNSEKHVRLPQSTSSVYIPESELVVFSMNEALATAFPNRWAQRVLNQTKNKALIINSLIGFDEKGQSHQVKKHVEQLLEKNAGVFESERIESRSFGWHELKRVAQR